MSRDRDVEYLRKVSLTAVPAALLADVVQMHAAMPAKDRQVLEVRMIRLFELLKDKGFKGDRHADLALAIDFRLRALADLMQQGGARGWTLPGEPGCEFISREILDVAATEPLVALGEGGVTFDLDRFRTRMLESGDARGAS